MAIIYQDYEKLKFLGKGSFAKIFKVRHKDLGYIRAIKVLTEEVNEGEDDKVYKTFLKECSLLLRLGNGGHPNIIRIYQPRKIDDQALVEMDYVDGVTLEEYISKHRFVPMEEIYRFIREIGSALAYCHVDCYKYMMRPEEKGKSEEKLIQEYGVAHNDIHSNNIMRKDLDGSFILLDFGLAIQDDKAVKSSSRRDGAAEYIPPEKWSGVAISNEKAIDIYGFGILLYQMLTGRVPFILDPVAYNNDSLQTLNELRSRHEKEKPADILPLRKAAFESTHDGKTYERDYPEWLDELVFKCLEKNPDDRFHDAKELLGFFNQHQLTDELEHDALIDDLTETNASLQQRVDTLEEQLREEQLREEQPKETPPPPPVVPDINPLEETVQKLTSENEALASRNAELEEDLREVKAKLLVPEASDPVKVNRKWTRILAIAAAILLITTSLGLFGAWRNVFDDYTRNRINELQEANNELSEQLANYEAKSSARSSGDNSKNTSNLETTISQLTAEKKSHAQELSKKDEEIKQKDKQIETLKADIKSKDKQIETLKASDQTSTITKLQNDNQKLKTENKNLKDENKKQKEEIATLNKKVENLTELLLKK